MHAHAIEDEHVEEHVHTEDHKAMPQLDGLELAAVGQGVDDRHGQHREMQVELAEMGGVREELAPEPLVALELHDVRVRGHGDVPHEADERSQAEGRKPQVPLEEAHELGRALVERL